MNRKYIFRDTDDSGFEEYDISGSEYLRLMEICFKYSDTVSFRIWSGDVIIPEELDKYRIPVTEVCLDAYSHYYRQLNDKAQNEIHHYVINADVKKYILSVTDSMFKWIDGWGYNNPEDICFYRSDKSIFFKSTVHDGICALNVGDGENVEEIIENKLWKLVAD